MPDHNHVETLVLAALERAPEENPHRWPVRVEYDVVNRVLTLDGQVQNVAAKRHAYECATHIDGVEGVIDQLRVQPAEPRGDGAIRVAVVDALLSESSPRDCGVHALHGPDGDAAGGAQFARHDCRDRREKFPAEMLVWTAIQWFAVRPRRKPLVGWANMY